MKKAFKILMKSSKEGSPSVLERVRKLPNELKRKLKSHATASTSASKLNGVVIMEKNVINELESPKKSPFYSCRYLGQTTVYTLLPKDCNDFALLMEETRSEKRAPITRIKIDSDTIRLTYLPPSPIGTKSKDLSPQHLLPPRAGGTLGRPKSDHLCQYHFENHSNSLPKDENELFSLHSRRRRSISPHTHHGVRPQDTLDIQYDRTFITHHQPCRGYPREEESLLPPVIPHPELISLSDVAYCVTIPDSRLFLLTSRGTKGLVCRVFLFSKKHKADELKSELAACFQNASKS